ncbi:PIN domain-containing protein [Subtercola frigoramans]|uniref:Uncharacterized protein n=1 Tax=Subtercola frigoramans TaxID=120298 RepID=A0ABS2L267_9MICO|nr:hypothetical protein [Subtercola frigoramans]MBM7471167.1 hypothetical protein [Subtercola frigoramans]
MTKFTLIDAGPALNFFSAGHKDLLIAALSAIDADINMPEEVETEVLRKARQRIHGQRSKFAAAERRLGGLVQAGVITVLHSLQDDPDLNRIAENVFADTVSAISGRSKDLGETMVIIHARRQMELGKDVVVLIDDGNGQKRAKQAGVTTVIDTASILIKCAKIGKVESPAKMKIIYEKLRTLDNGLVPWPNTRPQLRDPATYGAEKSITQ